MKICELTRALLKPALLPVIALLGATPVMARIVVDDSAPEPPPEKPGIHVPGPNNATGANAQGPTQDTLAFFNKDQLHGTLQSIDANGLRWQSPDAHDPIVFRTTNIAVVKLDSHKQANPGKSAQKIGLTNGDELPGNILSLDDKNLVLDTWYAGRITISRAMLRHIVPISGINSAIYEGPTGMEGWTMGRMGGGRSWNFRDGSFIGSNYGTVGRDVKF